MPMIGTRRSRATWVGVFVGAALGLSGACAGKGKRSQNPQECMSSCEQDKCGYDPNALGNDEYLECLDACQDECS